MYLLPLWILHIKEGIQLSHPKVSVVGLLGPITVTTPTLPPVRQNCTQELMRWEEPAFIMMNVELTFLADLLSYATWLDVAWTTKA